MSEKITLTREELKGLIDRIEFLESKVKKCDGDKILLGARFPDNRTKSDAYVRQVWDKIATAAANGETKITLELTNGEGKTLALQDLIKERLRAQGHPTSLYFDERKNMHEGAVEAELEARIRLGSMERDLKTDPFLTELRITPKEEAAALARGQEIKRFEVDLTKIAGLLEEITRIPEKRGEET